MDSWHRLLMEASDGDPGELGEAQAIAEQRVWDSTHKSFRTVIDGVRWVLELDPVLGTCLVRLSKCRKVAQLVSREFDGYDGFSA